MGVDRSNEMTETKEGGQAGQADSLFLAAWDTARSRLKILMIPRYHDLSDSCQLGRHGKRRRV